MNITFDSSVPNHFHPLLRALSEHYAAQKDYEPNITLHFFHRRNGMAVEALFFDGDNVIPTSSKEWSLYHPDHVQMALNRITPKVTSTLAEYRKTKPQLRFYQDPYSYGALIFAQPPTCIYLANTTVYPPLPAYSGQMI